MESHKNPCSAIMCLKLTDGHLTTWALHAWQRVKALLSDPQGPHPGSPVDGVWDVPLPFLSSVHSGDGNSVYLTKKLCGSNEVRYTQSASWYTVGASPMLAVTKSRKDTEP